MVQDNKYWEKKDLIIGISQCYNLAHADMIQKGKTIIDTEYLAEIKERTRIHYATLVRLQKDITEQLIENNETIPEETIIPKPTIKINLKK